VSVVERWEIVTCANCGAHRRPPYDKPCNGCSDRLRANGFQPTNETRDVAVVPAEQLQRAVEALRWVADRYAQTLAGKSVRDADEALERARLIVEATS
jgi:hypothetical protein